MQSISNPKPTVIYSLAPSPLSNNYGYHKFIYILIYLILVAAFIHVLGYYNDKMSRTCILNTLC